MIHSFSCKNFYSFRELTTVSFVVNDNAPDSGSYFTAPSGTRLSRVETVIGPNASGKTNLLKVLLFLKWLIVDSFNVKPDDPLPVQSFVFGDDQDTPIELVVVFEIDGKVYTYSFVLDGSKIISEKLELTSVVKKNKSSKQVFARTWNGASGAYDFTASSGFDLPKEFENLLRSNASMISVAARLNHKDSQEIADFWQHVQSNVIEAGWIGDHLFPNAAQQLLEALDFYAENDELKAEAEKLLSRFDLGFDTFEITKEKKEDGHSLSARAVHIVSGQKHNLNLRYESSGTKQLFILLKTVLQVLGKGGVAVLDEFDVNLHPEIVLALFELFVHSETNPHNAQLLLSTHSHIILSELDKYQVILVEKKDNCASESWRLDEVSGVRADDNYYSKYLAGAYGAVPNM